jgi:nucleoside phosphorylase
MALSDLPVDSISEADLQRLIDSGIGEGPNLEYKRATYGASDQDHSEFLADISAFANTDGGDLILGVEETDGRPAKLCGIQGNADVELLRLESIARAGLQPRIPGLRMRFVPLANGGNALLIRVPSSRVGPHRVTLKGRNRFWARQGSGKYEPDVGELRLLFNGSTDASSRARAETHPKTGCPICSRAARKGVSLDLGNRQQWSCPKCGNYEIAAAVLPVLAHRRENDRTVSARLSFAVRHRQQGGERPLVDAASLDDLLHVPLPRPRDQVNLFIAWMAREAGDNYWAPVRVDDPDMIGSIVGALDSDAVERIIRHMSDERLISKDSNPDHPEGYSLRLEMSGWDRYYARTGDADVRGGHPSATLEKAEEPIAPARTRVRDRTALILTVLEAEREGVLDLLQDIRRERHRESVFHVGKFHDARGVWKVIVAQSGIGNRSAADAAREAIERYRPDLALLVGIAGGVRDVRIGDLVAATEIYLYDTDRLEVSDPRPRLGRVSYLLEQTARTVARNDGWLRRLRIKREDAPRAFLGPIISGDKVVLRGSTIGELITSRYGELLAVEREAHGFMEIVRENSQVKGAVIRGIADLLTSAKSEHARKLASDSAAAFAFEMLATYDEGESVGRDALQVIPIKDVADKVDFGIITFREDEFNATLDKFRPKWLTIGERHYNIAELSSHAGRIYRVAIVRVPEQGESAAQHATAHTIADLDPSCIVLIGIAGAKPESEFTLGDVVVATRLHDFSVSAALPGGRTEVTNQGGPVQSALQVALANLPAITGLLGDWSSEAAIGRRRPPVELAAKNFLGNDPAWKKKVKVSLTHHFGADGQKYRNPLVTAAAVGGANVLMKDPGLLQRWLQHARDLKATEMELTGAFMAARSVKGDRPVLAIRGISDVVGFVRDPDWTQYACLTAASFARAYLASGLSGIEAKSKDIRAARAP